MVEERLVDDKTARFEARKEVTEVVDLTTKDVDEIATTGEKVMEKEEPSVKNESGIALTEDKVSSIEKIFVYSEAEIDAAEIEETKVEEAPVKVVDEIIKAGEEARRAISKIWSWDCSS